MKKLLSLLSVLTISGTAIPTTIAASPYQKEKTKILNKLETLKINNLREIMELYSSNKNINKRQTQNPNKRNIHDFITVLDLGDLKDNYEDTILHAIERLNPRIRMNEIRIAQLFNRRATIVFENTPNNFSVNDSVLVNFNISSQGIVGNSRFYIPQNNDNVQTETNNTLKKQLKIKIQRPKIAPPTPPTKTKEPLYATVLPKSQRNIKSNVAPPKPPRNLNNLLLNTNLGELEDNLPNTILNRFIELNVNINRNQISISNITTTSATIISNQNSIYIGNLEVFFTLNYKDKQNLSKISDNEKDSDSNSSNNQKIKNIITKFNNLSKQSKQNKLNYQSLPENKQKAFKDKLRNVGLGLTSTGISGAGILGILKMNVISSIKSLSTIANYIKNSLSSTIRTVFSSETGEAVEMTSLLSESTVAEGLTATKTLSVTEGSAVVATEGAVIGTEAGTAAALAPETLGLSLVIGGLVIAGTAILWWINSDHTIVKHESHNQYNEIEKYYKFLAHDQLKLDININEWNKIKQIYQENTNNYQQFKNKIKSEISNFHKEDHSGWGGSITDEDINTLINILYNHFQEINNHFLSNHNHGWKIITNTVGSYFIIEEE